MRRRDVITRLGGAAAAWPFAAHAQETSMPLIGYLSARSPGDTVHLLAAFRKGLGESGFIENQNVAIEFRWALGRYDRLPALGAELVRRPLSVLVATGGEPAALAAKSGSSTIPIVFVIGGDPVRLGLAASFNRPGGNSTGVTILAHQLEPKRLGLLHQLVPSASTVGVLLNPDFPAAENQLRDVQAAARVIGLQIRVLPANNDQEIDAAFAAISQQRIAALSVTASPFFDTRRERIVALASRYAVPTMYQFREYALAGGLASYGVDSSEAYRQAGIYTAAVLKGAKPAELPVLSPTKFVFAINLNTAKALGLEVPPGLSAMADEVIE